MFKKFSSLFSRRKNIPVLNTENTGQENASPAAKQEEPTIFKGTDVSDEHHFLLLTGIKEEEFIVQVLSAIEIANKSQTPIEDDNNKTNSPGIQKSEKEIFESFEVVKRMRFLEETLSGKEKHICNTYNYSYYHEALVRKRKQWNGNGVNKKEENNEDITESEHTKDNIYATILTEDLIRNNTYIKESFFGDSNSEADNEIPIGKTSGIQADLKREFALRSAVKEERLLEIRDNLKTYSIKNAQQVYKEYHSANTLFFWNLMGLMVSYLLLNFVIWYLLSPYQWKMIPLAMLLTAMLLFIPARGFAYLLRTENGNNIDKNAYPKRLQRTWHIVIDILIPIAVVLIILFINWPVIEGNTLPVLMAAGIFLLLLAARAGAGLWQPIFRSRYVAAQEKLFEKRSFTKYRKQHNKELAEAGLNDYSLAEETDKYINGSLAKLEQYNKKLEELIDRHKQKSRTLFADMLKEFYEDESTTFNAHYNMTGLQPYLQEIKDVSTVRRLLARLEYLYDMATESKT
jgi:hypothetical protein